MPVISILLFETKLAIMVNIKQLFFQLRKKWGAKVFFSLVDQGIFSLSNFLVTFLLGRWLSETEYGVFSIVFVVFLFLSGFYNSFIFEPLMVFGPGYADDKLIIYLVNLFRIVLKSILVVIPICAILFLINSLVSPETSLLVSIAILIVLLPIIMSFWLARQACYVRSNPRHAILGDVIYALILIGSVYLAVQFGILNTPLVFIGMALASLIGALPILYFLRIDPIRIIAHNEWFSINFELLEQWDYSKWALATSLAYGASTLAFIPLVGVILGLEQAGLYRAMQNLVAPLQQISAAFISLLLPWTSRQRLEFGARALKSKVYVFSGLFLLISLLYLLPINLFANEIIQLYKKDYYIGFLWAIPIFSLIMLLTSITNSFWIVFRALEKPKSLLVSKIASVAFIFSICIYLAIEFHFAGLMAGIVVSVLIEIVTLYYQWRKVPIGNQ